MEMTETMKANRFKNLNLLNGLLMKKYTMSYLIVSAIANIVRCEKILTDLGFTVERNTEHFNTIGILFSKVFWNGEEVGSIDIQGFPAIEFNKKKRHLAARLEDSEFVIAPIKGIHRVLDWHTTSGKMHKLAGGQTVMHVEPVWFTEESFQEWVEELKLQPIVDHYAGIKP